MLAEHSGTIKTLPHTERRKMRGCGRNIYGEKIHLLLAYFEKKRERINKLLQRPLDHRLLTRARFRYSENINENRNSVGYNSIIGD